MKSIISWLRLPTAVAALALFLAGCNTTTSSTQTAHSTGSGGVTTAAMVRAEGKPVIEAPEHGRPVTVRTETTSFDIPFPLWDGKKWRHDIRFDGGKWSMHVTTKLRDDGMVVLDLYEPPHGNRHRHPARSRDCVYDPNAGRVTNCTDPVRG